MVAIHGSVVKSPLHSRCAFNSRVVGKQEVICYLRITRHGQGEILCEIDLSWGDGRSLHTALRSGGFIFCDSSLCFPWVQHLHSCVCEVADVA
jgi:hypothetical protein